MEVSRVRHFDPLVLNKRPTVAFCDNPVAIRLGQQASCRLTFGAREIEIFAIARFPRVSTRDNATGWKLIASLARIAWPKQQLPTGLD
jgi:hypothetical protein